MVGWIKLNKQNHDANIRRCNQLLCS